ncbi:MAG: hypothetical protein AVDCRST_MAG68-5442 [uncultured Gemmatimonadetes bacterium]|uniref:Uncharacterized protein n=1 Tax=uncultured Gemmatimonadota bacterium TaxID=203437 RepID=A0A6J4MUI7_9BACT|nr:MAG: hypothetical protein AVDCRST_MAG68-5442 [uncultured Gemmatimonadota bacterium]
MPVQASPAPEAIATWKRPTRDLVQYHRRRDKVRIAQTRNRVPDLQQTRGYRGSRRLRIPSEHVFAEAKRSPAWTGRASVGERGSSSRPSSRACNKSEASARFPGRCRGKGCSRVFPRTSALRCHRTDPPTLIATPA